MCSEAWKSKQFYSFVDSDEAEGRTETQQLGVCESVESEGGKGGKR